ncbi:hypothetical protein M8818_001992 [Zalaria obscura]|uniref:Uncharacterized protein n=1 Tax=Zalaria obscura TaxID=2024903 RepID=A0ACC3SJM4_9PEZI
MLAFFPLLSPCYLCGHGVDRYGVCPGKSVDWEGNADDEARGWSYLILQAISGCLSSANRYLVSEWTLQSFEVIFGLRWATSGRQRVPVIGT